LLREPKSRKDATCDTQRDASPHIWGSLAVLTLNLLNFRSPLLLSCRTLCPCKIREHDYNGNGFIHPGPPLIPAYLRMMGAKPIAVCESIFLYNRDFDIWNVANRWNATFRHTAPTEETKDVRQCGIGLEETIL
jgi:hypothetical protein